MLFSFSGELSTITFPVLHPAWSKHGMESELTIESCIFPLPSDWPCRNCAAYSIETLSLAVLAVDLFCFFPPIHTRVRLKEW